MVTNAKSAVLRCVVRVLAIASLCVAGLATAPAEEMQLGRIPAPGASPTGPVKIGVYLFAIQELDFSKHTFHPKFEVWFRWRGDAFDPIANLHVVGARSQTVTLEDRRKLANGENYAVARVDAVVNARSTPARFRSNATGCKSRSNRRTRMTISCTTLIAMRACSIPTHSRRAGGCRDSK